MGKLKISKYKLKELEKRTKSCPYCGKPVKIAVRMKPNLMMVYENVEFQNVGVVVKCKHCGNYFLAHPGNFDIDLDL